MKSGVRVLCTGQLSEELVEQAAARGVDITVLPFIHIEPIEDHAVEDAIMQIAEQNAIVVFTSLNGVDAVRSKLGDRVPGWKIFSMGGSTRDAIEEHFGKDALLDVADNGAALAASIIATGDVQEIQFFCGDQRRDELPEALDHAGITVNAIEVYRTTATTHRINDHFDAVLFFSPSAVKSFYSVNDPGESLIVFAIGSTTAAEAAKHASHIIVPDRPGREQMVDAVIDFYSQAVRRTP